jgi:hypothetical protein
MMSQSRHVVAVWEEGPTLRSTESDVESSLKA